MANPLDPRAIRAEARALMRGAQVPALPFTALYLAVTLGLSLADTVSARSLGGVQVASFSMSFVSVLVMLIATVLGAGYTLYCLRVERGEAAPYDILFDAFPFAGKVVAVSVLQGALIGVGLTLFVVPGIVLALCYGFAICHICEDPNCGAIEALRRSRVETRGFRWQLFVLLAGFLPLLAPAVLAMLALQVLLSPLFPDTLAGDLLFVLVTGVLMGAIELYLRPWLSLAWVRVYRILTGPDADAAE